MGVRRNVIEAAQNADVEFKGVGNRDPAFRAVYLEGTVETTAGSVCQERKQKESRKEEVMSGSWSVREEDPA